MDNQTPQNPSESDNSSFTLNQSPQEPAPSTQPIPTPLNTGNGNVNAQIEQPQPTPVIAEKPVEIMQEDLKIAPQIPSAQTIDTTPTITPTETIQTTVPPQPCLKKYIVIASAVVLALAIGFGAYTFFFSGTDEESKLIDSVEQETTLTNTLEIKPAASENSGSTEFFESLFSNDTPPSFDASILNAENQEASEPSADDAEETDDTPAEESNLNKETVTEEEAATEEEKPSKILR